MPHAEPVHADSEDRDAVHLMLSLLSFDGLEADDHDVAAHVVLAELLELERTFRREPPGFQLRDQALRADRAARNERFAAIATARAEEARRQRPRES